MSTTKDHYRVVIVADTHIGAERRRWLNKMGVTYPTYDAPFFEAMQWKEDNDADMLIVAGDVFDDREPRPMDYIRAREKGIDKAVAGNHDIPPVGLTDALWAVPGSINGTPWLDDEQDLQIVALPWPRPSDYPAEKYETITDEIDRTRIGTLAALEDIANNLIDTSKPAIGVGHVMLSYGGDRAQPREDDIVVLGKDIVIPHEDLLALPNIGGWYLGHVHKPGRGYVGSTQPTDWGDLGQKSFTVVDIYRRGTEAHVKSIGPEHFAYEVNGWEYQERQIPYTTSLKLLTVEPELQPMGYYGLHFSPPDGLDGIRATYKISEDDVMSSPTAMEDFTAELQKLTPYVEVIVNREVKRVARVETPEPLSKMPVRAAALKWHENRATEPELRDAAMARFDAITGEE